MMKIRNLFILILIVVLVVVYYLVASDYMRQNDQKANLETQVAEATAALALVPQPPADLAERLAAAQDNLDAESASFNIDTNSTRILNMILKVAADNKVKAIPLVTQPWVLENTSNQSYSVFHLDIAATGTYPQLVKFLTQLENGQPQTLIIESLMVEANTGSFLLSSADRDILTVNADIKIAIYASPMTAG
jgi:Type II secretion system (T2SS), protein M subtype b